MSPLGTYWSQSSMFENAAYIVRDDLIFTACRFDEDAHEGEYYTEYDEPTPEEVRLLASLALSVGFERGFMAQYPHVAAIRLGEHRPLNDPEVVAAVEHELRLALASRSLSWQNSAPLPPSEYRHFHWPLPEAVQKEIYAKIDDHNDLLIRGLGTWLKSSMLNVHAAFQEEANYPLWISLDASLAIILSTLRSSGISCPTAIDAQNFINDAFGQKRSGLKYFSDYYDDRIMTIHPQSRFGTFAFAPISHDDFYWLHNDLREVYRYILLGDIIDPQSSFDTD